MPSQRMMRMGPSSPWLYSERARTCTVKYLKTGDSCVGTWFELFSIEAVICVPM